MNRGKAVSMRKEIIQKSEELNKSFIGFTFNIENNKGSL